MEKGECDPNTGKCYCTLDTKGDHCEECIEGFFGKPGPPDYGHCYQECHSRTVVDEHWSGNFGLYESEKLCLFIIRAPLAASEVK